MNASRTDAKLLAIGRLVGTHGVRGELKLHTFNPQSEAVVDGVQVVLRKNDTDQTKEVASVRPHKRVLLVTIAGCDSMTAAEALVGSDVYIDEADLPETGPDELYHFELMGMEVVTVDGRELGKIVDVMTTAAHDVCTVRGQGREHLIPLIADVIDSIDKTARRLVIDPLPGLLDL